MKVMFFGIYIGLKINALKLNYKTIYLSVFIKFTNFWREKKICLKDDQSQQYFIFPPLMTGTYLHENLKIKMLV